MIQNCAFYARGYRQGGGIKFIGSPKDNDHHEDDGEKDVCDDDDDQNDDSDHDDHDDCDGCYDDADYMITMVMFSTTVMMATVKVPKALILSHPSLAIFKASLFHFS